MSITLQEVLKTDTLEIQRQKFNQVALDIFNTLGGSAQLSVLDVGISDGLVTDPSLYFNNEVTLGIFRAGAGELSFAAGGEKPLSIKSPGAIFYKDLRVGTEGIGSLTPTGNTNGFAAGTYILGVDGGSGSNGNIQFDIINYAFNINAGSEYVPGAYNNIALSGGSGTNATGNIIVAGIEGSITNGGTGYGDTTYSGVTLTGGTGNGDVTADLVSSSGAIIDVIITNNGTGYVNGDVLSYGSGNFQFTVSSNPYQVSSVSLTADDSYSITNVLSCANTLIGGTGQNFSITITNKGYLDTNSIIINTAGSGYLVGDSVSVTNPLTFTINFTVATLGDDPNCTISPINGAIVTQGPISSPELTLSDRLTVGLSASNMAVIDGVSIKNNYITTSATTNLELTTSDVSTKVVIKGRDFAVSDGTTELFTVDNATGNVSIGGGGNSGSGGISFGTLQIIDNTIQNTATGYNSFGSIVTVSQTTSGSNFYQKTHTGVSLIGSIDGVGAIANFVVSPWESVISGGTGYVNGSYSLVNLFVDTGVTYSLSVSDNGANSGYTITGTDSGGAISGDNPSVTCGVGDLLEFNVNAAGHPFYIQSVSAPYSDTDVVVGVQNGGAESGTVRWKPATAGTYYYVCGIHASMTGTIIVSAQNASGVEADVTISGGAVTEVSITAYGTNVNVGDVLVANVEELGGTIPNSPLPSGFGVNVGNTGVVTGVTITNGGTNYTNGEVVTADISPNYIETVSNLIGGSGYIDGTYPSVSLQSGVGVAAAIQTLTITTPGTGLVDGIYYATALTSGSGSNAVADITVTGGSITSVSITNPGTGYAVNDVLGVTGIPGTGITVSALVPSTGTSAVATFTVTSGTVSGFVLTDAGTGYTQGDVLTVDPNFDGTGNGSTFQVTVATVNSGSGWSAEITKINGSGILIIPADDQLVKVKSTSGFVIPSGDGSERPSDAEVGCIRYNNQSDQYEGFNGTDFVSLGGVRDVDGNSYITAELTAGNDDNTLTFYNDGYNTVNVTKDYFDFHTLDTLRSVNIIEGANSEIATYWKSGKYVDPAAISGAIEYVYYQDRLYQVTSAGSLDVVSPPSHTTGTVANGSADLLFVRLVYDDLNMTFDSLNVSTQTNLNFVSDNITFNTNLALKTGDIFIKDTGYIGFGFTPAGNDDTFLKLNQNSVSVTAELIINSGYGGTAAEITVLDNTLEYVEYAYVREENNKLTLIKGSNNLGTINAYDITLYSSAKIYIVADNITTGEKESVEYSIIDNGTDIYNTEYNQISTNASVPLFTSDIAYQGNNVKIDFTIGSTVATSEEVRITMRKVLVKK
jgi:plastocyanin